MPEIKPDAVENIDAPATELLKIVSFFCYMSMIHAMIVIVF